MDDRHFSSVDSWQKNSHQEHSAYCLSFLESLERSDMMRHFDALLQQSDDISRTRFAALACQ